MSTEVKTVTPDLPEKIYPVNYAGFWDFSETGLYDASVINEADYPNEAEKIAQEMSRRYNSFLEMEKSNSELLEALNNIVEVIEKESTDGKPVPRSVALIMRYKAAKELITKQSQK